MTICVGSISRNDDGREQYAVVSSDRMATLSLPSIEWEQNLPKTTKISENCVVSTAGSAIAFSSILRMAQPEIDKKGDVDIATVVEILRKSYERVRKKKLEEEITSKIGLSLAEFYSNQGSISPQIIGKVFDAMAKYDYNLELLVAGVDDEGPHIYRISNPGRADCFDSIGYHAIGVVSCTPCLRLLQMILIHIWI